MSTLFEPVSTLLVTKYVPLYFPLIYTSAVSNVIAYCIPSSWVNL